MYGSKIYRSDGKVWMSPSLSPIVFQRKQVVSLSGGTEFNTKYLQIVHRLFLLPIRKLFH